MEPTAVPLTWPAAIPRTKNREKSRFKITLPAALKNAQDHPHYSDIAWSAIEQWRVFVPGVDAPPSENIDPLAETGVYQ